jgi:hypothetical protein
MKITNKYPINSTIQTIQDHTIITIIGITTPIIITIGNIIEITIIYMIVMDNVDHFRMINIIINEGIKEIGMIANLKDIKIIIIIEQVRGITKVNGIIAIVDKIYSTVEIIRTV